MNIIFIIIPGIIIVFLLLNALQIKNITKKCNDKGGLLKALFQILRYLFNLGTSIYLFILFQVFLNEMFGSFSLVGIWILPILCLLIIYKKKKKKTQTSSFLNDSIFFTNSLIFLSLIINFYSPEGLSREISLISFIIPILYLIISIVIQFLYYGRNGIFFFVITYIIFHILMMLNKEVLSISIGYY